MDSLVAIAIHDAKNSLNALGVWLAEARHEFSDKASFPTDASSPALANATAITARLTGQLVELLALYRAGDGTLRLAIEDHCLGEFLRDVLVELSSSSLLESQIAVETDFSTADEIGDWAFDAYQVKFILLDGLRNALRHAAQQVRFSLATHTEGGIVFRIEDYGPGFPPEMLRDVDANGTGEGKAMNAGSSGLGLSFARLIAGRHATVAGRHGSLELANDGLGKNGARFSLILP